MTDLTKLLTRLIPRAGVLPSPSEPLLPAGVLAMGMVLLGITVLPMAKAQRSPARQSLRRAGRDIALAFLSGAAKVAGGLVAAALISWAKQSGWWFGH